MPAGEILFNPATQSRTFEIFLTGLFFIRTGMALLQTGAIPYITILGPIESAASRMSIMGIGNKGAGGIAPMMGAILITRHG